MNNETDNLPAAAASQQPCGKYEIRRMGERGLRRKMFCSGTTGRITCLKCATFWLVRLKSNPMDRSESRLRKCILCAAIDAKSLHILMPDDMPALNAAGKS